MGSLTSASTYAEVRDQYRDNASYRGDGSVAKAKLFEEAVMHLIELRPDQANTSDASIREEGERWQRALEDVRRWLAVYDADGSPMKRGRRIVHADVRDYRS